MEANLYSVRDGFHRHYASVAVGFTDLRVCSGVFGCMSLLTCHDACPKELPLATQIAFMRRKMVKMAWTK